MSSNIIKMDVVEVVDKVDIITDTNILYYYDELDYANLELLIKLGVIKLKNCNNLMINN
jgi:hypothetical protein